VRKPSFLKDYIVNNTRGLHFTEIAMVGEKAITIYNSTGLSEAPLDLWDALNAKELGGYVPSAGRNQERTTLVALGQNDLRVWRRDVVRGMGFH
jgi:hypothetical protein